ncbi:MAG: hypothetical protein R3190_12565 [Thermoanaerobaculia bacterium]|nr:hypothetical protein [Thermoanaerobaculia bacterium]
MRGRIVGATRIVGFGRRCVAVGWREERGREVVDFLFRDLPRDEIGAPQARLDLALDPSGRGGRLGIDGRPLWSAPSTLALARRLLHEVLERLSDRCEAGLLAHAAAVERDAWRSRFRGGAVPARPPSAPGW